MIFQKIRMSHTQTQMLLKVAASHCYLNLILNIVIKFVLLMVWKKKHYMWYLNFVIKLLLAITGEFGVVYRGYLTGWQDRTTAELVAIKTLKSEKK